MNYIVLVNNDNTSNNNLSTFFSKIIKKNISNFIINGEQYKNKLIKYIMENFYKHSGALNDRIVITCVMSKNKSINLAMKGIIIEFANNTYQDLESFKSCIEFFFGSEVLKNNTMSKEQIISFLNSNDVNVNENFKIDINTNVDIPFNTSNVMNYVYGIYEADSDTLNKLSINLTDDTVPQDFEDLNNKHFIILSADSNNLQSYHQKYLIKYY